MVNGDSSRRKVLVTTGLSLGTLVGSSSVAAAVPSNSARNGAGQLKVENGRFTLDVAPNEVRGAEYRQWLEVVEDFNEAIEAGHLSITNKNGPAGERTGASETTANETTIEIHSDPVEMIEGDQ